MTDEVREVLLLWKDFLHQSTCRQSILLSPAFYCKAFADACADSSAVGLGGYVKFPSGPKRFFQFNISKAALCSLCSFFPSQGNPQHFIAACELLSQCALVWTTHSMLPLAHPSVHMVLRRDNSASAWKGLSLANGLCVVLRQFCDLQRRIWASAMLIVSALHGERFLCRSSPNVRLLRLSYPSTFNKHFDCTCHPKSPM